MIIVRSFVALMTYAVFNIGFTTVRAAEPDEPTVVVKKLYAARTPEASIFNQFEDKAILDRFFRKDLANLIFKDAMDAKGEVGALDFDPLYFSQDPQITEFDPGETGWGGDKKFGGEDDAVVQTTFKDGGKERLISYQFARNAETREWKIFDIKYPDGVLLTDLLRGINREKAGLAPPIDGETSRLSYKIIEGTASPDGRHAFVWGIAEVPNLDEYLKSGLEVPEETVVNYLVNVETGDVVGSLDEGLYWEDAEGQNLRGASVNTAWATSKLVLVDSEGKWGNRFLRAFRLGNELVDETLDIQEDVEREIRKHLAKTHAEEYKNSKEFLILFHDSLAAEGENSWEITTSADVSKLADEKAGIDARVKVRFFLESVDDVMKFNLLTVEEAPALEGAPEVDPAE